jgi:hypothetical protein
MPHLPYLYHHIVLYMPLHCFICAPALCPISSTDTDTAMYALAKEITFQGAHMNTCTSLSMSKQAACHIMAQPLK